jgi:hypothetical protein
VPVASVPSSKSTTAEIEIEPSSSAKSPYVPRQLESFPASEFQNIACFVPPVNHMACFAPLAERNEDAGGRRATAHLIPFDADGPHSPLQLSRMSCHIPVSEIQIATVWRASFPTESTSRPLGENATLQIPS